jgi:exonuclease SbcC
VRPVRLRLAGFTAFRDEQELDFEGLDLFAVTGPTGSGKSSLLDAVAYALYGKAPRVGKGISALISQGQPRLRVGLDFDVDGKRYRVTRSTPRTGASTILLERKAGDGWESYGEGADRINECNKLITALVGLDFEAFTRSVLLPQGQFADLLKGDPKERRAILTELLGLELFNGMAARAREIAAESRASAQTNEDVLKSQFAGIDLAAVKDAKETAVAAKALSESVAAAESAFEAMARGWRTDRATAEVLGRLAGEASGLAESAEAIGSDLDGLAEEVARFEAVAQRTEQEAGEAADAVRQAQRALQDGEGRLGTLEHLAALRAGMEELHRLEGRLHSLENAALQARKDAATRNTAVERSEQRAQAAGEEMARTEIALREAQAEHERASHADVVGALTHGLKAGDPCPVCARPLVEVPRGARDEAAKPAKKLQRAQAAARKAEADWGKADRDVAVAASDADAAAAEMARTERDVDACLKERDELVRGLEAALDSEMPEDPLGEVAGRVKELKRLAERAKELGDAAAVARSLAADARQGALAASARGAALVGSLRALPVARMAEDWRKALPGFDLSSALTEAIPKDPARAAAVARAWAGAAIDLSLAISSRSAEIAARLDAELEQARDALPEAVKVPDGADPDEILERLRAAARELVAEATGARKDAERLAQQLRERRALEKQVKMKKEEAALYGALAQELRADRLIDFLQGEALQLLAIGGSDHLRFLSQERYRLVFRSDEFYVEDRQNGDERRSVRTLSGGETFLASMALALALAEQIRSLAVTKKARLESLFIDEGFGALDPESLEVATEALSQLGGADRMVGVITHVRELADRMPVQIRVEREARGSRVTS